VGAVVVSDVTTTVLLDLAVVVEPDPSPVVVPVVVSVVVPVDVSVVSAPSAIARTTPMATQISNADPPLPPAMTHSSPEADAAVVRVARVSSAPGGSVNVPRRQ
jgi:hypothetical protein